MYDFISMLKKSFKTSFERNKQIINKENNQIYDIEMGSSNKKKLATILENQDSSEDDFENKPKEDNK